MTPEELNKVCNYIKTHRPKKTAFETIDAAISAVMGRDCRACTKEDLVNRDDTWLIPDEERHKFAGMKGRGWAQGFVDDEIKRIEEAVEYAISHADEISNFNEDRFELNEMREQLLRVRDSHLFNNGLESDNNRVANQYDDEQNIINKTI